MSIGVYLSTMQAATLTVKNANVGIQLNSLGYILQSAKDGDRIVFDSSLNGKTIAGSYTITKSVVIDGGNQITLDGRIIVDANTTFENMKFTYSNYPQDYRGIIITKRPLTLLNCIFRVNSANVGLIANVFCLIELEANSTSVLHATNCVFENNQICIFAIHSDIHLKGCTFTGNKGNLVWSSSQGSVYMSECIIKNNSCVSAIRCEGCIKAEISDCQFVDNVCSNTLEEGGVIRGTIATRQLYVTGCSFINNKGPCVYRRGLIINFEVRDCNFENNANYPVYLDGPGGAATTIVEGCSFKDNAHGVNISSTQKTNIVNCTFFRNTNSVYLVTDMNNYITNCTFSDNINPIGIGKPYVKGCIFNNEVLLENLLSQGYNVYNYNLGASFIDKKDKQYSVEQSLLLPYGNNGGKTPTMLINTKIPDWQNFIRIVPQSSDRYTDQRGYSLPATGTLCAGAVEMRSQDITSNETEPVGEIRVFPNPVKHTLYINYDREINKAEVYSLDGKQVHVENSSADNIDMSRLPNGIYYVIIHAGNKRHIRKIVKQ
jgi:parallel beta-helix repeat protein